MLEPVLGLERVGEHVGDRGAPGGRLGGPLVARVDAPEHGARVAAALDELGHLVRVRVGVRGGGRDRVRVTVTVRVRDRVRVRVTVRVKDRVRVRVR